jgi:hypothetical protein
MYAKKNCEPGPLEPVVEIISIVHRRKFLTLAVQELEVLSNTRNIMDCLERKSNKYKATGAWRRYRTGSKVYMIPG